MNTKFLKIADRKDVVDHECKQCGKTTKHEFRPSAPGLSYLGINMGAKVDSSLKVRLNQIKNNMNKGMRSNY